MNKKLRVSIVIPVYNEERHLAACLEAIALQTSLPHEVIVVDNNSNDDTLAVASAYNFVTLLRERSQGVVYARDTGFNAATGEIIGRIDADTVIDTDWVARLQTIFADGSVDAVTGKVHYLDVVASRLIDRIDLFWRRRMSKLLGPEVALQGANMAIRRSAWKNIRSTVCHLSGLHEDFDLAIHANQAGYSVAFNESLSASICSRQAGYNFRSFSKYVLISPRTYAVHGVKSGRRMYEVVAFVMIFYVPIKILHRGYLHGNGSFSWSQLLKGSIQVRVNPATFVD